jgi:hypothetical protein
MVTGCVSDHIMFPPVFALHRLKVTVSPRPLGTGEFQVCVCGMVPSRHDANAGPAHRKENNTKNPNVFFTLLLLY